VDLPNLFTYLAQEREMNEIHVEAGFKLNGSLHLDEATKTAPSIF
jgi:diaminohydroxyphosphoribosylaminopyrimidine deaminase/5-amino-6-(5-phosphoribosylamino)uracil reductase